VTSIDVPFEEQLLVFRARLAQLGLSAAIELLNDRSQFRYTAMHGIVNGRIRSLCVFDRLREDRAYVRSAFLLETLCCLTATSGEFVSADCSTDHRLPSGGPIVSYCGVAVGPLAGPVVAILCHFDFVRREVKPCELAFLRAVAPLLFEYLD
jgi:hypothetical protein